MPAECGSAQDVNHSTDSGEDRTIVFGETVAYTCNRGYSVDFVKNQSQFEAKCAEDGEFTTLSECFPDCKKVPEVKHTSDEKKRGVFHKKVEYSCGVGCTLDGTPDETSSFELQCLHNGVCSLMP